MTRGRARAAALAALLFVVVVAIVTVRQLQRGQVEVDLADAATQKSDWPMAITHARAAAEALAPGSPWPERGWLRLEAIGHDAEARGDDETALLDYGAMRAAAMATRGPFSAWAQRRAQADEGLARVAASERSPTGQRVAADSMLDALHEGEPAATWLLCTLAVSALAMVGGLGRLAWLGPEAAGARAAQVVAALGLLAYAAVTLTR
jgi:hypothetical protein